MAAVAIFKLICPCAAGPCEQLVAHTYSENRLVLSESGAYVRNGVGAELGVARTVGYEEAVVVQSGEVVVPRHAYELDAPVNQAAEYVALDAAIDEADFFAGAFVVAYHLLAADYRYLVVAVRVVDREAAVFRAGFSGSVGHYHGQHGSVVPQRLGKSPGIDAAYSRNLLFLEPAVEAADRVPVAVLGGVLADDQASDPDLLRFEIKGNTIGVKAVLRYTVVADQRISDAKNLS